MKLLRIISLFCVSSVVLFACTKTINVDVNNATPKIVIEGNVTDATGPYEVQITQTVNLDATNVFPPVSGAVVTITDVTSSITETLQETSPGIYQTRDMQGFQQHTYQMSITALGQNYTATSTMPEAVHLDSVTFIHTDFFGSTNINAVPNYQDPLGVPNYYTFTEYVNSRRLKDILTTSDRLSDGKYITQQLFVDSAYVSVGDTVLIEMHCRDKNSWDYFNTLEQVTGDDFGTATPANPIGNISNGALGYFSAHTLQTRKLLAY